MLMKKGSSISRHSSSGKQYIFHPIVFLYCSGSEIEGRVPFGVHKSYAGGHNKLCQSGEKGFEAMRMC